MNIQEVILTPEEAFSEELFPTILYKKLGIPADGSVLVYPLKRSIDARSKKILVRVQCSVEEPSNGASGRITIDLKDVSREKPVVIIGSGPAGLFAALRLIELGIKPIILERGKDVQSRRRDIAAINKDHIVNPDSNYCFGEGGAGTYSDGKLYTRSTKRGNIKRILEILVSHGAKDDILFDAHPHIGTNKLPKIIQEIRDRITQAGGEVHFNARVTDLLINRDEIKGVILQGGETIKASAVIMATGHSARDVFEMLQRHSITIEAKPFALGVRVEHPQLLIDQIQYHCSADRGPYLPASSYSLVHQAVVDGMNKGVFSFCMCPGGFIVPSATNPGEVVVNGMSPSRRDSKFANSGIVASVELIDFMKAYRQHDALAGMFFQADVEKRACQMAGGTQKAPAQRLVDFIENKTSSTLLETSYQPGLSSVNMRDVLPDFITSALKQGFKMFGKKMKGYLTNEAQIVGVESRTSSPVRIPRDKESFQHIQIKGLYPCGEGAGYAGGIVSAAMDGERCAEAAVVYVKH